MKFSLTKTINIKHCTRASFSRTAEYIIDWRGGGAKKKVDRTHFCSIFYTLSSDVRCSIDVKGKSCNVSILRKSRRITVCTHQDKIQIYSIQQFRCQKFQGMAKKTIENLAFVWPFTHRYRYVNSIQCFIKRKNTIQVEDNRQCTYQYR